MKNFKEPSFVTKIMFKIMPKFAFRSMLTEIGVENSAYEKLHEVFAKSKRIDISPTSGSERGFILILDRKTSLFFYQNGDHFEYDGFEIGEYEKGDVTVFDK